MNRLKNVLGFRGVSVLYILSAAMYLDFFQYVIPSSEKKNQWQVSDWLKHGTWGSHCYHAIDGYVQFILISNTYQKPIDYIFVLLRLYLKTFIPLWIGLILAASLPNFTITNFVGVKSNLELFLIPIKNTLENHGNYIYHYYATNFTGNFVLLSVLALYRFMKKKFDVQFTINHFFGFVVASTCIYDLLKTSNMYYNGCLLTTIEFYYYYTGLDLHAFFIGVIFSYYLNCFELQNNKFVSTQHSSRLEQLMFRINKLPVVTDVLVLLIMLFCFSLIRVSNSQVFDVGIFSPLLILFSKLTFCFAFMFVFSICLYKERSFAPKFVHYLGFNGQWLYITINMVTTFNQYLFTNVEFGPYSNTILILFILGCWVQLVIANIVMTALFNPIFTKIIQSIEILRLKVQ